MTPCLFTITTVANSRVSNGSSIISAVSWLPKLFRSHYGNSRMALIVADNNPK